MNLDQFAEVAKSRIPTAGEFLDLAESMGWRVVAHEDGRAALRVPDATDPLALALARMLRREPYRTNVVAEVRTRQSPPPRAEPPASSAPAPAPPPVGDRCDRIVRSRIVDEDTGEVLWECRQDYGAYRDSHRVHRQLAAARPGGRLAIQRRDPFTRNEDWYSIWSDTDAGAGTPGVDSPRPGDGLPAVPGPAAGGGAARGLWAEPARAGTA